MTDSQTLNDPYRVELKVYKRDDGSVVVVRGAHNPLILSATEASRLAAFIRGAGMLQAYPVMAPESPETGEWPRRR
jgi:hypothetical protein